MAESLSSRIHCSQDGRSWTDPITNRTFLAGVRLEQYIKGMFLVGETPIDIRLAFLHEATHHWCFLSPVGSTLAILQLRIYKRALQLNERASQLKMEQLEDMTTEDILRFNTSMDALKDMMTEDVLRFNTAISIMRPLAEGLALFAEFDAAPTTAPIMSLPVQWATMFFGLEKELTANRIARSNEFTDNMHENLIALNPWLRMLVETRMRSQAVDSKAGVLCSPLSSQNGGYLPGYLTVKNLWHYARSKSKYFQDSDFFLCYLRSFFYDDLGFVATLLDPVLDPDVRERDLARATIPIQIRHYFQQRFRDFLTADLDAHAERYLKAFKEWEELLEASGNWNDEVYERWADLAQFFTDPHAAQLGEERMRALLAEEPSPQKDDKLGPFFNKMQYNIIARRRFMRIGSLKGRISIQKMQNEQWAGEIANLGEAKTVTFSWEGRAIIEVPVPSDTRELKIPVSLIQPELPSGPGVVYLYVPYEIELGEGEGSLDLFFSWEYGYKVCRITLADNTVVYLFFDARHNEIARREFISLQENIHIEETLLDTFPREWLDTIINNSWMYFANPHQERYLSHALEEIYLAGALLYMPDHLLELCTQTMRESGMYGLLGGDRMIVEALALLDMTFPISSNRELVSKWIKLFNMDIDEVVAVLREYERLYQIPTIVDTADHLACFI